ncbi:MAG: FadR/GntR family transcriptional regulator [Desulfohalobiaceae bacterium]
MDKELFKPIKPKSVSDQIFEQLRDLIFRGKLKPGEKLPPERELSESFGVSRPSVKAAINRLVNLGLVEQRQGQGTFVRSLESRYLENPLRTVLEGEEVSLYDLLEVRLGLEVQAVGLAAKRATEEDIQALETCVQDMLSKVDEGQVGSEEDVAFHMSIAFATKNSAQIYLMKNFYDLLFHGIRESRFYLQEAGNLSTMGQQHAEILQAIRDKDAGRAKSYMERHINYVMEFCLKLQL